MQPNSILQVFVTMQMDACWLIEITLSKTFWNFKHNVVERLSVFEPATGLRAPSNLGNS